MANLDNMLAAILLLIGLGKIKRFYKVLLTVPWKSNRAYIMHMIFFVCVGFCNGFYILVNLCIELFPM